MRKPRTTTQRKSTTSRQNITKAQVSRIGIRGERHATKLKPSGR